MNKELLKVIVGLIEKDWDIEIPDNMGDAVGPVCATLMYTYMLAQTNNEDAIKERIDGFLTETRPVFVGSKYIFLTAMQVGLRKYAEETFMDKDSSEEWLDKIMWHREDEKPDHPNCTLSLDQPEDLTMLSDMLNDIDVESIMRGEK